MIGAIKRRWRRVGFVQRRRVQAERERLRRLYEYEQAHPVPDHLREDYGSLIESLKQEGSAG